jgi:hypothetical protein
MNAAALIIVILALLAAVSAVIFQEEVKEWIDDLRDKKAPTKGPSGNATTRAPSGNATTPAAYDWEMGPWSTCSQTCGTGTQSRTVKCRSSQGAYVSDSSCNQTKPPSVQFCNEQSCSYYTFDTGTWGECSASCGGGTQDKIIYCKRDTDGADDPIVPSVYCGGGVERAKSTRGCNTQACTTYSWATGPWGSCNHPCNRGYQRRTVECVDQSGNPASETDCKETKPTSYQACNEEMCYWTTQPWGECTKDCAGGTQTRVVSCYNPNTLSNTERTNYCLLTKPLAQQDCNMQACEETSPPVQTEFDYSYQLWSGWDTILYINPGPLNDDILSSSSSYVATIEGKGYGFLTGAIRATGGNYYVYIRTGQNPPSRGTVRLSKF